MSVPIFDIYDSTSNHNEIDDETLYVIKRNGDKEEVSFDKIKRRIQFLSSGLNINIGLVTQKVISEIKPGITTMELDLHSASICVQESSLHSDYGILASRILVSNHHKKTSPSFSESIEILHKNTDVNGKSAPLINDEVYQIVMTNKDKINDVIQHQRDYRHDYFGFKTMERAYLLKSKGKIIERPQYMWMRVALGIHRNDFKDAMETYDLMSQGYFTHATPTLYNAGTCREQLSSCFLLTIQDDSIDGIFETIKQCALISKTAGGIGLSVHTVRSRESYIRGTGGTSNGLIPMLQVFNRTAKYVDQCFSPDTYIYTDRGPKKICHLEAGVDHVYNKHGSTAPIQKVLEHSHKGDTYVLTLQNNHGTTQVEVTGQHPIWAIQKENLPRQSAWIDVDKLTVGDIIPIPEINYQSVDFDNITEDMCQLYCLLMKHLSDSTFTDYQGIYHVILSKTNYPDEYQQILNLLTKAMIQLSTHDDANIIWEISPDFCFNTSDFWKTNSRDRDRYCFEDKQMSSRIMNLPANKLLIIYNGLKGYEYNEIIQQQVKFIGHRLGLLTDYEITHISKDPFYDEEESGRLMYDLEFRSEHNYVTEMGLVHNGGGKRPGAFAIYLEPSHPDIKDFLELKTNTGSEELKARDLFYALWIPDLFMERVEKQENWTLLDPDEFPGLCDVHGDEYRKMYLKYEKEFMTKYRHQPDKLRKRHVSAQDLWYSIMATQAETGTMYFGYKDAVNRKSNQSNLGTIRSSNLCIEINLFTSPEEIAVCNLASICLPRFVDKEKGTFDFETLQKVVKICTKNLNKVIDINYYPVKEAKTSNLRHRPIGIGVQGLADTYALLRMPFDSPEADALNRKIFEHMYLAGVEASLEIAKKRDNLIRELLVLVDMTYSDWEKYITHQADNYGHNIHAIELLLNATVIRSKFSQLVVEWQSAEDLAKTIGEDASGLSDFKDAVPLLRSMKRIFELLDILKLIPEELDRTKYYGSYSSYIGSPMSQGKYQFDLWNEKPAKELIPKFETLMGQIQQFGIRNSTIFALMPTASTAQIQGNNECFEPYSSNIYSRKTLSGEFQIINKHLVSDLKEAGLWNKEMKDRIIGMNGSVQNIPDIPDEIKSLYKTVWEIKQKVIIDQAATRGPFICQTQSMNLFLKNPTLSQMSSMHFYGWKKGLKTGIYYLRTGTKADAQKVTIDPSLMVKPDSTTTNTDDEAFVCSRDNPDCEACGA